MADPDVHRRASTRSCASTPACRARSTRPTRLSRAGRRPDPAQARGPQPHRRPQDPQRARPGAADQADGQDPGDRRDRRRPARRRQRHRRGVLRPRLHRLHGRGRHQAPGAQRRPDAAARRQGGPGRLRQRAPSRTPSTRRCATGSPASTTRRYLFGTAAGPHPFPSMVRDFTRGIGDEARAQCLEQYGALPDAIARLRRRRLQRDRPVHRVPRRRGRRDPRLRGRRRRRRDRSARRDHRRPATRGVLHGARTFVLQDEDGQTIESHSISAGLDYPGVGPAARPPRRRPAARRTARSPTPRRWTRSRCSAAPRASSRPSSPRTRSPARSRSPGAAETGPDATILVNLSGRGDKDMDTAIEWFGLGDAARPEAEPDRR